MAPIMSPSKLLESYESLLLSNLSAIQSIESGLRNVTWLLPGRFEDAEVASEGLYALLNIVSDHHDTLLAKRLDSSLILPPHPFVPPRSCASPSNEADASPGQSRGRDQDARTSNTGQDSVAGSSSQRPDNPPSNTAGANAENAALTRLKPLLPPPSDHVRYTRYWTQRSSLYRKASRLLVTIGYVQLLVEMISKKRSERRRWKVVLGLEILKTVLKLVIMGITKRPVLNPPVPQREYDLLSLPSTILSNPATATTTSPSVISVGASTTSAKAKPALSSLPSHGPLRNHLYPLSSALPDSHLPHPLSLLPEMKTASYWTSEIIESTVTLLQVVLLLRASRRSPYRPSSLSTLSSRYAPYLVPLFLSFFARSLRPSPTALPDARDPTNIGGETSLLLAEHFAQLDRRLAMRALMTGPMWVGWTRPKIMRVVKGLERIPVIGLVGELMEGYLPLVDDYFYYTST